MSRYRNLPEGVHFSYRIMDEDIFTVDDEAAAERLKDWLF